MDDHRREQARRPAVTKIKLLRVTYDVQGEDGKRPAVLRAPRDSLD